MATVRISPLVRRPAAAIIIVLLTGATALAAGSPLDSSGFEGYSASQIAGQQAVGYPGLTWAGIGSFNSNNAPTQMGVDLATVQTSVKKSGSQALKVDRTPGVNNRWAVPLEGLSTPLPSHRFILVDWDMNVTGTEQEDVLGPFFGVEAYDGIVDPPNSIGLLGSLGVDATTGEVVYQIQDSGTFTNTGSEVTFDAWNHFGMVFDFTLREYSMYLNGTRLLKTGFVDRSYSGVNQLTDADISAIAAFDNPQSFAIGGTAYVDNFRILDGVPGDFDFDGDVDSQDLGLWKTAYNTTAVGDADGDNDSDGRDFAIWQQNLGTDVTPAVAVAAATPEPSAAMLVTLGALALARARRRFASR